MSDPLKDDPKAAANSQVEGEGAEATPDPGTAAAWEETGWDAVEAAERRGRRLSGGQPPAEPASTAPVPRVGLMHWGPATEAVLGERPLDTTASGSLVLQDTDIVESAEDDGQPLSSTAAHWLHPDAAGVPEPEEPALEPPDVSPNVAAAEAGASEVLESADSGVIVMELTPGQVAVMEPVLVEPLLVEPPPADEMEPHPIMADDLVVRSSSAVARAGESPVPQRAREVGPRDLSDLGPRVVALGSPIPSPGRGDTIESSDLAGGRDRDAPSAPSVPSAPSAPSASPGSSAYPAPPPYRGADRPAEPAATEEQASPLQLARRFAALSDGTAPTGETSALHDIVRKTLGTSGQPAAPRHASAGLPLPLPPKVTDSQRLPLIASERRGSKREPVSVSITRRQSGAAGPGTGLVVALICLSIGLAGYLLYRELGEPSETSATARPVARGTAGSASGPATGRPSGTSASAPVALGSAAAGGGSMTAAATAVAATAAPETAEPLSAAATAMPASSAPTTAATLPAETAGAAGATGASERAEPTEEEKKAKAEKHASKATRYLLTGEHEKAAKSFSRAVKLDPENAKAFRGLGLSNEQLGETAAAKAAYLRYLELAPTAPDAAAIRKRISGY